MGRAVKKQRGTFERPNGSGIWWVRYADQYGQEHREKVGRRSAAVSVYQQRKTEIRQGKFEPEEVRLKHKNILFGQIIDDYLKASEAMARKSLRDIRQRSAFWKDKWADKPVKSILRSDIELARLELSGPKRPGRGQKATSKKRSVATVNRYLATLRAAFMLALDNDKIEKSPFRKVRLQNENNKRIRFLSEEEECRLFAALPKEHHPMVLLALRTGLRKSELFFLQWCDVDFGQEQITVRESKSGKSRTVPLSQTALMQLRALAKVRLIDNPYIFPGEKPGTRRSELPKGWERFLKEARIDDFHWHDLRHTCASRPVMAGVDLNRVREILGHADITMTLRYAHLAPDHLKAAIRVLDAQPAPMVLGIS